MEWREILRGAFQSVRRYFVDRKKKEWREGLVGIMRKRKVVEGGRRG